MSYNILDVVKDAVTGNLEFAPDSVIAERRALCAACEVRNETLDMCTICGCFIPTKIRLAKSECPMEVWMSCVSLKEIG